MHPIITDTATLAPILAALETAPFIAMDTEFLRESTYYPQLCLIQIATPDALWLIDPLANNLDLAPLWHTLNTVKHPIVFHAAEQDLELIQLGASQLPQHIHDTQIAAALLGLGEQMGYARLVQRLQGHSLDKSQSRTDWSTRPLSPAQCQYAADDVRYLRIIYPDLLAQLQQSGRLRWFDQECAGLNNPDRFRPDDDRQWRRVRGQQRLTGAELVLLQAIAAWREATARQRDIPRRWILSDDLALDLAINPPDSAQSLQTKPHWSKQRTLAEAHALFERLEQARQIPSEQWPQPGRYGKPDAETAGLLVQFQEIVQQVSRTETIAPSLLATTDDLLSLIRHPDRPHRLTTGWRDEVIGTHLKSLLPCPPPIGSRAP